MRNKQTSLILEARIKRLARVAQLNELSATSKKIETIQRSFAHKVNTHGVGQAASKCRSFL